MTELRIRIDADDDLAYVQSWADEHENSSYQVITDDEDAGLAIEPVTAVILIATGVAVLAGFIRDWIKSAGGGTVVDLRPDAQDQIYRDKALNYGWLMVISADGKVEVNVKDAPKEATERLIEQVISGAFSSVKDVVKAATDALGADKVKADAPPAA